MNEDGHEWQISSGIAFAWRERLCTKWMRRECEEGVEGRVIVVRNWGRVVFRWVSVVRHE
jgi:hypothetical protein